MKYDQNSMESPLTIRMPGGKFLAHAKPGSSLMIGVVGDSEETARAAYGEALNRWHEILESRSDVDASGHTRI